MKEKMICRGDLFYYDFGDNSGSVQSGERPVLVIQADDYNQNAPTIIVAAVTSVSIIITTNPPNPLIHPNFIYPLFHI